eukprot:1957785-Amphidinium_carterae.1
MQSCIAIRIRALLLPTQSSYNPSTVCKECPEDSDKSNRLWNKTHFLGALSDLFPNFSRHFLELTRCQGAISTHCLRLEVVVSHIALLKCLLVGVACKTHWLVQRMHFLAKELLTATENPEYTSSGYLVFSLEFVPEVEVSESFCTIPPNVTIHLTACLLLYATG